MAITLSSHCHVVEQNGVTLDVQIYRFPGSDWVLELANHKNSLIGWDDDDT